MALTRQQKTAQLEDMQQKIAKSASVMFAHYIGLSVADVNEFRAKLREKNAEMKVGKKTLLSLALKGTNMPVPEEKDVPGPVACIFSYDDPVAGAQIAKAFGKDHEQVALVGGIFDGKILTAAQAQEFASLPSRQVLLGTFAVMIRSPLTSFAGMASSPLSGFARALSQLAEKGGLAKEEASAAPAQEPAPAAAEEKPTDASPAAEEAPKEEAAPAAEEKPAEEEKKADDAPAPESTN